MPKPANRWQPSVGDLLGIVAIVMGVVVYVTQPDWKIAGALAIIAMALVIFAAIRHSGNPILRGIVAVAVIGLFIAFIWRPIWMSFHKDYPRIAFNWPVTLNPPTASTGASSEPPDMPPLNLPGPPLSKFGKMMYLCPYPPEVDARDAEAAKAQIRRNAEIYGKALGLDLILNDIPYGLRFDVTANDTSGQMRMQTVERYVVRLEKASNGIFVTFTIDFIGAMAILGQMQAERNSEYAQTFDKAVEQLGFAPGKCRML